MPESAPTGIYDERGIARGERIVIVVSGDDRGMYTSVHINVPVSILAARASRKINTSRSGGRPSGEGFVVV